MMKRHMIYAYWLLLLAPTLVIGVLAYWALQREQRRQQQSQREAAERLAEDKAGLFAKSIRYRVETVQRDVMASLIDIPDKQLVDTLADWDREQPLVRNVFVWTPNQGLALPDPNHPGTREQLSFIMRYEVLFSGRMTWQSTRGEPGPGNGQSRPPANTKAAADAQVLADASLRAAKRKQSEQSSRQPEQQQEAYTLPTYNYANTANQQAIIPPGKVRRREPCQQGWTAWFSGNQLHLLGWAQMVEGGPVRGIELEQAALLSRLFESSLLPEPKGALTRSGKYACMLVDGQGQVIYQDALRPEAPEIVSAATPLGSALPHWQVTCVYQPDTPWTQTSNSFMLYGSLLVGAFLAAILTGGSLLLMQAHRSARDAARKTSFVSNVSHELKTPLTSIRMYAELLNEGRIADENKRRKYEGIIVSETERLSRLVNNVLDFSRLEQGRKKYRLEPLRLDEAINTILGAQEVRIKNTGLELKRQLKAADETVVADRDAVEQIVINLIDNACKYAADGKELVVQTVLQPTHAEVRVMDRGPGIARSECERIFEKFHRLDDSLSRGKDGVGLGLSITRRLARDMRGDLSCRPRPDGGAVFYLKLARRETNA